MLSPFYMQWVVDGAVVSEDRDLLTVLGLALWWLKVPFRITRRDWPELMRLTASNMLVWHIVIIVALQALSSGRAAISQFTRKPAEPLGKFRQGQFQVWPLARRSATPRVMRAQRRENRRRSCTYSAVGPRSSSTRPAASRKRGFLFSKYSRRLFLALMKSLRPAQINALARRGLKRGVASLCIGGGEATATSAPG